MVTSLVPRLPVFMIGPTANPVVVTLYVGCEQCITQSWYRTQSIISSNTIHRQPISIKQEGGTSSYPQFVPGASEGELFGEVHTQYVQSVSSDNK